METIISEDSPLTAYLEGNGEAIVDDSSYDASTSSDQGSSRPVSFAPPHRRSLSVRASRLIESHVAQNPAVSKLRDVYASAVSSTLGAEDNTRFLEHFRYIIIAAQLLDEHIGPGGGQVKERVTSGHGSLPRWSILGVAGTALIAFVFAWLLHWAKGGSPTAVFNGKTAIALFFVPVFALLIYAYGRRQWLKFLRTQAIDSVVAFTGQFRALEHGATGALALIQEVELVSRGYRLSSGPMPPITRMEGAGQPRRCMRLRKELLDFYAVVMSALTSTQAVLDTIVDKADLERFLEVYDLNWQDLQVARRGFGQATEAMDDEERHSLKTLRVEQFRLSVLRRLILCSLLSIPATGRKTDSSRWRSAIVEMDKLGRVFRELTAQLSKALDNEDVPVPSTPSPRVSQQSPHHAHLQSQVRRISGLTSSIRSLQAKLWLLREDSTRALSSTHSETDVLATSASLKEQYEALGGDLQALMQAWGAGKNALAQDISRHSRRVSLGSMLPTPSTPTFGKRDSLSLATLIEDPSHALRALNGEAGPSLPLSPPTTEDGSNDEQGVEDVFEGIAVAKVRERNPAPREQRIKQMKEERERAASLRESREAGQMMVRELQSVIRMRPTNAPTRPRRTSAAAQTAMPGPSEPAPVPVQARDASLG